jgi:Fe-S cluster biosynthesis and repair protein YggX
MSRTVHCILLKTDAPGLDRVPYPGELGKRIFNEVSKEAWARLTPVDPKARKLLETEMEKFFFGPGSEKPEAFKDP